MFKTQRNNFKNYEYVEKELKFFINSKIRMKILNCLLYGSLSMKDIHTKANLTYSSISNNIHKLEEKKYITENSGRYELNNLIKMKFLDIIDLNESIDVINNYSNFWKDHNTESIDIESLKKISQLKDSKIIESDPSDIYKTHNYFTKLLKKSYYVKSVFPIIHHEYYGIFENLLKNKVKMEFLLDKSIVYSFLRAIDPNLRRISLKENKLKIKYLENIKFHLTVTNNFISFGLFKEDNNYDQNKMLISSSKEAINWGNETFEIYNSNGKNLYMIQ